MLFRSLFINGKEIVPSVRTPLAERTAHARLRRHNGNAVNALREIESFRDAFGIGDDTAAEIGYLKSLVANNVPIKVEAPEQTYNHVIFNDKNIVRAMTEVGASPEKIKFSEVATPILERMGREPFREDTRGAKEKIDEIIRKAMPTGKAGESFVDSKLNALEDALDIGKPLERALRSSVYDALPEAEANELMTRVAMSQTAHDNGVADMALLNGGIKFNKELGLEEIGNSQYNWKVLAQNITDFAKAHDLSHDEANYYAHTALVAKRMVALYGEIGRAHV